MSSTTTSAATAAPRTLPALYRFLLRSSRTTFKNDAHTMAAWRQYVRQKMPAQAQAAAAQGSDGTLSSQFVDEWLDVAKVLKMNVVQGVRKQGTEDVYQLRFTKDTELVSNDSIKKGRDKRLTDLEASKGALRYGRDGPSLASSSSSSPSSSSSSSVRSFSISARTPTPRSLNKLKTRPAPPLPHPAPHFPSTTLLADGSSIFLVTTSPRSVTRLTRDSTNHPLWNPALLEKGKGADGFGEDDARRVERFRRRFGGSNAPLPPSLPQQQRKQQVTSNVDATAGTTGKAASKQVGQGRGDRKASFEPEAIAAAAMSKEQSSIFDFDDLQWMSGGRQAKVGTSLERDGKAVQAKRQQ